MRKELEDRWRFAKRKDRVMYVTASEHTEMLAEITDITKAEIDLWKYVPVAISETLAVRQAKEAR